jgi:23S rRNA (pseudouridine1915-N3)-methyltransferase
MRLVVTTVGRLKSGPDRALFERYRDRFEPLAKRLGLAPVAWHEINESRAGGAVKRRREEGALLLKHVREAQCIIALDERGKALTSEAFARFLAVTRDGGTAELGVVVGGPDGLDEAVYVAARLRLSLSMMTLPHGLARILLTEQLYRAATILSGHPYHRA